MYALPTIFRERLQADSFHNLDPFHMICITFRHTAICLSFHNKQVDVIPSNALLQVKPVKSTVNQCIVMM